MMDFIKRILFACLLSVSVVLLVLISKTGLNQTVTDHALYGSKGIAQDRYSTYLGTQLSLGKSTRIRSNVKQIAIQQDAEKQGNKLLKIMLTYDDSDEYNNRSAKARMFAESPILANPDFFGSDLTKSGGHLINVKKLHSKFISAKIYIEPLSISQYKNLVNVMIYSKSLHWKGTQDKKVLTTLYAGTFDLSLERYRQLAYIRTISDVPETII